MSIRLKVGDTVIVKNGAEKGKTGKISAVHPKTMKVIVDGVNIKTRHRKPSQSLPQGGVFEEPHPIAISKVGIVHPTKKTLSSRIGYKISEKGLKKRIYRSNDKEIR